MLRGSCTAILVATLMAICCTPAFAADVPGCVNPADSALNQYCETIPAASGGQTPHVGTPALATQLPARVVRGIARDTRGSHPGTRRALLSLPASGRSARGKPIAAKASSSSLPLWLILVLAGTALALTTTALAGWLRRRRAEPPAQPSA